MTFILLIDTRKVKISIRKTHVNCYCTYPIECDWENIGAFRMLDRCALRTGTFRGGMYELDDIDP